MKNLRSRITTLIVLLLPAVLLAGGVNGIFSTSVYSFAREDLEGNAALHLRAYQTVLLSGNNIGLKNSKFMFTGVVYYDHASDFGDEQHFQSRIYNFNIYKRLMSNHLRLRLGRQSVYTSSVIGRMDGLSAEYIHNSLKFKLFGGGYIPGTGFSGNPIANHIVGTELRWFKNERMFLSMGLSNKAHVRENYRSVKTYRDIEVPATIQRRFGVNGYLKKGRTSLYILTRFHPSRFEIKDLNVHVDYNYGRIDHLSFEFKLLEPRIPDNSIFSVFDAYNTKEYRLSSDYKLTQSLNGFFQYRFIQFNNDHSQVLNVGIKTDQYFVQANHQNGYGGTSTHFIGQASRQVSHVEIFSRFTLGNYRLIEGDLNELATFVLGSRIPLYSKIFVRTELQVLSNKYYDKDIRMLVNLSYRF